MHFILVQNLKLFKKDIRKQCGIIVLGLLFRVEETLVVRNKTNLIFQVDNYVTEVTKCTT